MSSEYKVRSKIQKAMLLGNYGLAIDNLNLILSIKPNDLDLLRTRGEAYLRIEKFEEALSDLAKVVESGSKNISVLSNFSVALMRCKKHDSAKLILDYLLELDPSNFDANINLCNVYQALGRPEENLKSAMRAVEIKPNSVVAYNNLGTAFGDLDMISEAREALRVGQQIDSSYIPTAINLAQLEVRLRNYLEAASLFEKLLLLKNISPSETELVKYYLGYCYLYQGNLSKGWDYYEYGFGSILPITALRSKRKFNQQKWNGKPIGEKTLLIWREQGLGEEIEFSTCLTDVSETGVNVIFECDHRLVNIFQRTFPNFTVRPESFGEDFYPTTQDFHFQCALGSLPRIFRRSLDSFNRQIRPLSVLPSSIEKFQQRLSEFRGKKLIGICWRSGMFSIGRNLGYTALSDWSDLLSQKDFHFINLQYGECESELMEMEALLGISIVRWPDLDLKNDLENVLGLIKNLDSVVTIGTAVSSLSASCGITTYLLTTDDSLFKLGQKNTYPWYKNMIPMVAEKNAHIAEKLSLIPELLRKL